MNRRNFIGNLLAATAGFTILPGAGRIWRAERKIWRIELPAPPVPSNSFLMHNGEKLVWVIEWQDITLGQTLKVSNL